VAAEGAGFTDLVLAKNGIIWFIELKSDKGQMSPAQLEWEDALGEWYRVFRPSDLEEVARILQEQR
jgi:hypothetical protein